MTVGELIEKLQDLDKDMLVVLQSDAEGNRYSPLAAVDGPVHYYEECSWSGYPVEVELTEELIDEGYTEDDMYEREDTIPAVILWPVN